MSFIDSLRHAHVGSRFVRLFAVFDTSEDGVIDFEEFMSGLATYAKGTKDEKLRLLFRMYVLCGCSPFPLFSASVELPSSPIDVYVPLHCPPLP